MERIVKFIVEHAGFVPIVMTTSAGNLKLNWQIIIQTLLIAGVIGLVNFWGSSYTMQDDIKDIKTGLAGMETRMEKRIERIENVIFLGNKQ